MNKYFKNIVFAIITTFVIGDIVNGQDFFFGNNKPIADAGEDIKTRPGEIISLDGSKSYVGDGSKVKYHWIFSPGLALNSENDFSNEVSVNSYGKEYIKSVQTNKQILNVIVSENNPGTKLEVVLKIKDRIGFEDRDTLFVEYLYPKAKVVVLPDQEMEVSPPSLALAADMVQDDTKFSGIFIQGFSDNAIKNIDAQIINSIIMNEIKARGFQLGIHLVTDIEGKAKPKEYNDKCNSDACIAKNARSLNKRYVIAWNFSQSIDNLSLRLFESIDHGNLIKDSNIQGPYEYMNQVGIYGLESKLRSSVSDIMSVSNFKNDISMLKRFLMKNENTFFYGKYPIMLGAAYLFIDKILPNEDSSTGSEMPPGFPHD